MAILVPTSFATLLRRMAHERRSSDAIFDLPSKKWWRPTPEERARTGARFHGRVAGSPFGPAAGPHDQMAQNIVLSYLAGGRVMELKTVQILDELEIGRPCIDAATVGFNIEWSQELKLEEAAEEYVKAAMLVHVLQREDVLGGGAGPEADPVLYDISVGYDLKGIQSEPVRGFLRTMLDASAQVARLRAEIPEEFARWRDLDFPTRLAGSVTLSTFHGCPPEEIERICEHLIGEYGLHTVVKMNPTMLGRERVEHLLRERMGYAGITPRSGAFTAGLQFDEGIEMCRRLLGLARLRGVGFGAKFTNTLETESPAGSRLPDKVRYLSGRPLHVISTELMWKFRAAFGEPMAVTFSAGLEKRNAAAVVAMGCSPATTCTDMLKTGGFARMAEYGRAWLAAQDAAGVSGPAAWSFAARGQGGEGVERAAAWGREQTGVSPALLARLEALGRGEGAAARFGEAADAAAAVLHPADAWTALVQRARWEVETLNAEDYVATLADDDTYHFARNAKNPPKIDSHLATFDCISCDKCIPVCPNDANYYYEVAPEVEPIDAGVLVVAPDGSARREPGRVFAVAKAHQIANFADWCNECGNCDTFCPEYDGPYIMKPSFYGSRAAWLADPSHDGFAVWRDEAGDHLAGRIEGHTVALLALVPGGPSLPGVAGGAARVFASPSWIVALGATHEVLGMAAAADASPALLDVLWGPPVLDGDPAARAADAPAGERMSWRRIAAQLARATATVALGGRLLLRAEAAAGPSAGAERLDLWHYHCARKLLEGALGGGRVTPTNAPWWREGDAAVTIG